MWYPMIDSIRKKRKIDREIYERSQRIARERLRNNNFEPLYSSTASTYSSAASTVTRRREEPQEEFLTERDFEI